MVVVRLTKPGGGRLYYVVERGTGEMLATRAPVAQRIERLPPEQEAAGSIPAGRTTQIFSPEFPTHAA